MIAIMKILKNYAFLICLIAGILLGGTSGLIFGKDASIVKPIGDFFLNIMFVLIVPLVFFSVSSAIYNMKKMNMVSKLVGNILLVFIGSAVVAAVLAYTLVLHYNPVDAIDKSSIMVNLPCIKKASGLSPGELFVNALTVPDFLQLFTKIHLLPLIVFSIFFGIAAALSGESGKKIMDLINAGMNVTLCMMRIIMYMAPVGLGCYFADTVGSVGSQILNGYLNIFLLYLMLATVYFFGLNTIYVYIAGGRKALSAYWHHITTPSMMAIATSSSAACIPINIEASKRMGVPSSIAETVIPLGTNMHKDGSVMGGVFKIVFIFLVYGQNVGLSMNSFSIIGVALLVGIVMGAIPSGGMTGELLICSVFGFSPQLAGTLMIISTIIDVPATLINSTSNVASSLLVTRLTEGEKWIKALSKGKKYEKE